MRSEAELREALEVHGSHVYRFLRARGLSEQTAQDVYQDVFEIFLTSNQRFENAEHKRRWLIRVASNRCKQYYRKASTQRETPVSNESFYERVHSLAGDSCEQEAYFDKNREIWEYVDALSPEQRECIYLFYVEGYPTEEIAAMVQSSPSTVRGRLRRARLALRKRYRRGHYGLR